MHRLDCLYWCDYSSNMVLFLGSNWKETYLRLTQNQEARRTNIDWDVSGNQDVVHLNDSVNILSLLGQRVWSWGHSVSWWMTRHGRDNLSPQDPCNKNSLLCDCEYSTSIPVCFQCLQESVIIYTGTVKPLFSGRGVYWNHFVRLFIRLSCPSLSGRYLLKRLTIYNQLLNHS